MRCSVPNPWTYIYPLPDEDEELEDGELPILSCPRLGRIKDGMVFQLRKSNVLYQLGDHSPRQLAKAVYVRPATKSENRLFSESDPTVGLLESTIQLVFSK